MEKNIKIQTGKSLSRAIEEIVSESIKSSLYRNSVEEKQRQSQSMLGEKEEATDQKSTPSSSKTADAEKEKLKKAEITTKDIVDKLNTIRSGKSFKDSAISGKMDEYVNSLSAAEKTALFAFLKGLSQIVTGEIDPAQASDPSENPANVEMKKSEVSGEKRTIRPNVIKAPEKEKTEKKPSSEDTSGPVPISPKKSK
jgi:hypothetical protein